MNKIKCKIGKLTLKNPIIAASGTMGYNGKEVEALMDINEWGGFVTKTITLYPREGNLPPRIYDLGFGIINSIGLANPGWDIFKERYLQYLLSLDTVKFISIYEKEMKDWIRLMKYVDKEPVEGVELNLSCPNVERRRWQDSPFLSNLLKRLRDCTNKVIIAKISYTPRLQEIGLILKRAKIDAITLINSIPALALERKARKPILGNIGGGLSGPCIKPIALRCVYEMASNDDITIIGCGGIMDYRDVLDFLSVGATAVQLGTANIIDPTLGVKIIRDLKKYYYEKRD